MSNISILISFAFAMAMLCPSTWAYSSISNRPSFPFQVPLSHAHEHALTNIHKVERLKPFRSSPTISAHSNSTDSDFFACRFSSDRLRMVRSTMLSAQAGQLQSYNFAVFPRVEVIDVPAFICSFIVHPGGAHLHMDLPLVSEAMSQKLMPLSSMKRLMQHKFPKDDYEPPIKTEFFMSAYAGDVRQLLEPWMAYMQAYSTMLRVVPKKTHQSKIHLQKSLATQSAMCEALHTSPEKSALKKYIGEDEVDYIFKEFFAPVPVI